MSYDTHAVPNDFVMGLVEDLGDEDEKKSEVEAEAQIETEIETEVETELEKLPALKDDSAPTAETETETEKLSKEERRKAKVARWRAKRLRQKARIYDPERLRKLRERDAERKRRSKIAKRRYRESGRFARKGPEFVSITDL